MVRQSFSEECRLCHDKTSYQSVTEVHENMESMEIAITNVTIPENGTTSGNSSCRQSYINETQTVGDTPQSRLLAEGDVAPDGTIRIQAKLESDDDGGFRENGFVLYGYSERKMITAIPVNPENEPRPCGPDGDKPQGHTTSMDCCSCH